MASVVVVDDDEDVRDLIRFNLELLGHPVLGEAGDAVSAVTLTRSLHPDVLVLDMMMPGGSGAEVLRELTAGEAGWRPVVIAYSASPTHLELATSLGADVTVLKSGDMEPLLAAVSGL